MKITIKTLQQKLFTVDVDAEQTVHAIKEKINEEHGHPVASQKLIYSGKVLDDAKVVKDCNFKEKDFLVLMVSKAKAAPAAPAASTSTAVPTEQPAAAASSDAMDATPTTTDTTNPQPVSAEASASTPATTASGSNTGFLTGPALETAIQGLMDMGFERPQVERAMRASFNNPDRAADYLFNGIPPGLLPTPAAATPAAGGAAPPTPGGAAAPPSAATPAAQAPAAPSGGGNLFQMAAQQQQQQRAGPAAGTPTGGLGALGGGLGGLGALGGGAAAAGAAGAGEEQAMDQMRQMVRENPALLQELIQNIVATNPGLLERINNNPEALYQLLAGGDEEGEGDEHGLLGAGGAAGAGGAGPMTIELTQEEMNDIQTLQDWTGASRDKAAEAYLACGKNVELAANFLFEGGFQD